MRPLAQLALMALLPACAFFRSADVPMHAEPHLQAAAPAAVGEDAAGRVLVVLLPGFGDGPEDFVERGVVARLEAVGPEVDVIAADAHFGYYRGDFTVVERLHADVVAPALAARRYAKVWVVGVSMGGYGALAYAMDHADVVTGAIVLAPYLGPDDVFEAVRDAGGLAAWTPPDPATIEDDELRHATRLWAFLKAAAATGAPALWVGVGDDDGLAPVVRLVTAALPADHALEREGGHGWVVWVPLFDALVSRAL
ncbi:MAG: alpha/beta fold hydrolase [Deltaproteobacteria bacterium]|nr:alpha/beta fold hydrolase [Deltaproteobacteria bacterium]